jgi:protocatechuate 4,5-dioxygenase, beta chain
LVAEEFDVTTCQDMLVDHAFTIPLPLLWPGADSRPVRTVPIEINTVQHPLPSPARCFKLGQAVGRAIERYPADFKVAVVGSGRLSHQVDGKRAGFINKEFDLMCLDKLVSDPAALASIRPCRSTRKAESRTSRFSVGLPCAVP